MRVLLSGRSDHCKGAASQAYLPDTHYLEVRETRPARKCIERMDHVRNRAMGLRRIWTISHGHLDHSYSRLCGRSRLAHATAMTAERPQFVTGLAEMTPRDAKRSALT
jgi:hypothetical protein